LSAGRLAQVGSAEAAAEAEAELEPGFAEESGLGLGSVAEIGALACIGPGPAGALVYTGGNVALVWPLAGRLLPRAETCAIRVSPSRNAACPGKPSARILPSPQGSQPPSEH